MTVSAKLALARAHFLRAAAELETAGLYLRDARDLAAFFQHATEQRQHVDRLARYSNHVRKLIAEDAGKVGA